MKLERINITYPEVQADTLEEVVVFGMQWLGGKIQEPFIVDDSGLFVNALNGFPGVYSAYAYRTMGNGGILKLMKDNADRNAIFRTVIGVAINSRIFIVGGECSGRLSLAERGANGFGFDPIFIPSNSGKTFGEMSTLEKESVSHRGAAIKKLEERLSTEGII